MLMLFSGRNEGWNEDGEDGMRMGMQRSTGVIHVPDSEVGTLKGLYSYISFADRQPFPKQFLAMYINISLCSR